ncbi:MAG: TetR/AcrR family transcriptional regulator [Thermodesulfobacteriota bacterium]
MVRISKPPEERREEIVQAAQKLFIENGFALTKVSDIVKAVGVSQGTFYYYFKTKEEIVDTIVDGYIGEIIQQVLPIMGDRRLTALQKLERMSDCQLEVNLKSNRNIHGIKGVDIHEKIIGQLVLKLVPLQVEVMRQGVREGVFKTQNLRELTEIFVAAANILFDPGLFGWNPPELAERIGFITRLMETCYGAPEGAFRFYGRLMSGGRLVF